MGFRTRQTDELDRPNARAEAARAILIIITQNQR
jgi:hypothetical protein